MKRALFALILIMCVPCLTAAQEALSLRRQGGTLYGTLLMPEGVAKPPVVLIIAGSGPTDRNGNNPQMRMDTYKLLAEGLQKEGIASFRFDKRMIAESRWESEEADLTLDDYIGDVRALAEMLRNDGRFGEVVLAGHSEGGKIALAAALDNPDIAKVITIAGPGRLMDVVLMEQLEAQKLPASFLVEVGTIFESLKKGGTVGNISPGLASTGLFRASVQPYYISDLKHVPVDMIAGLEIPVMIVQGGTDIQALRTDYDALVGAQPKAVGLFIPDMSHPLKKSATADRMEQAMTVYVDPSLPLHEELVPALAAFVGK